jgi:dihydrofolate synthase/folylpolyglutamate synthase
MPSDDTSDYAAVSDYLFGLKPKGTKLGIDRMRPLAAALGHPEQACPVIHVAGTNGKGSVAAMLESALRAAGWRVGLFTSPHLVHVGERVQVNRVALTTPEIVSYVKELTPAADRVAADEGEDNRPSFFELMTAMAFIHFQRQRCDIAVVEVGLGGEFDATNIVDPLVSVITSIGLDHCEWLGNTIEEIAKAKAGIVKPARPVVIGRMSASAERVIRDRATVCDSPVVSVRAEFGDSIDRYPRTSLEGEYQRWNAATAVLALRTLGARWNLSDEAITRALRNVKWSGRWQRTQIGGRLLILDASHNPEGAEVLDRNLEALVAETGRAPIVITGVLGAERAGPLLAVIARHASEIHLVVPKQPRASSYAELESHIPATYRGRVVRATIEELFPEEDRCSAGGPADVMVVTGSIYLLGEIMQRLSLLG